MKSVKAFTIIELLIVFVIIILFPIIVISSFSHIKAQFALSRAAYQFAQNLREAQNMALSSKPYKDSSGFVESTRGYGIYLDISELGNTRYLMYADSQYSNIGSGQYDALDYLVASYDISVENPGIVIQSIKNIQKDSVSISFLSPDAKVNMTPLNKEKTFVEVTFGLLENPGITKSVLVNISGLIEVK